MEEYASLSGGARDSYVADVVFGYEERLAAVQVGIFLSFMISLLKAVLRDIS